MARVLTPFVLLGDTAAAVVGGRPLDTPIVIGVRKNLITPEVMSTFKVYLKEIPIYDNGFTYQVGEVPVRVKFIRNHYKFMEFPDTKFYMYDSYLIPNPFTDYWEMKHLVR